MSRFRISPALVVALVALFFALGGTAFALGAKVAATQGKCAQGTVRGLAEVTGAPDHGPANIPDHYTGSSNQYLGRHFSCGGAIQVKRTQTGTYFVKFTGNKARSAVASAWGPDPAGADVSLQPDGSFQVIIGSHSTPTDEAFTIVVF